VVRALLSHEPGGPETLRVEEIAEPVAGPGELLVRVRACSINYPDVLIIEDKYQLKPPRPFAPGSEISGEVIEAGEGVEGWSPGDRLIAATGFGGLAEKVVIPADRAIPLPPERSFVEGSALLLTYATAIHALADRGRLRAGQTLLVLGAAGGVGVAAVEVGKALGATVIAAARGADKLEVARKHGADAVIDYGSEDIRERIKAITEGQGLDVIFDPIGGDVSDAAFRSLRWEGRIVIVGFAAGRIQQIPANLLLVKNIAAVGLFWGEYRNRDPELVQGWFADLARWYEQGKIKPHVSHVLPAAKVAEAMELLRQRKSTGKIVLTF